MKAIVTALVLVALIAAPAFAHGGGEEAKVDGKTLVRQVIMLLQNNKDLEAAQMKLEDAKKDGKLDAAKLGEAEKAMKAGDLDRAVEILAAATGESPQEQAMMKTFRVDYVGTGLNYTLLALGLVSVALGLVALRPAKQM